MNWDDLRFIVAVYDSGSAVAAAGMLGVNSSTVQRRVARFEKENGVRLFERRQSGLTPTAECEDLVIASRPIEDRVSGIRREILGRDQRLEGHLVVTTTDTFMIEAMARHFFEFKKMHPAIELEVRLTNRRLNLSRNDADVTIRPSQNPPENLVGVKICDLNSAIYASAQLAENEGIDQVRKDLRSNWWVGLGTALDPFPGSSWVFENVPGDKVVYSVDTFTAAKTAVAASDCLGILPCVLGDHCEELIRIEEPNPEFSTSVWLLTHPEIRSAAKVRAFMDFMTKELRKDRALFEGKLQN